MDVDKVSVTSTGSWNIPLAAIFCLAIAVYVIIIIIGLSVRQCLLRKGVCGGQCPDVPCCNCAELGLHCAQACCNCGPKPSCASLMDGCCPADQECKCLNVGTCDMCQDCGGFGGCGGCDGCGGWGECGGCEGTYCPSPAACTPGPLCGDCTCAAPECSTINCLCIEISIKGRAPPGET